MVQIQAFLASRAAAAAGAAETAEAQRDGADSTAVEPGSTDAASGTALPRIHLAELLQQTDVGVRELLALLADRKGLIGAAEQQAVLQALQLARAGHATCCQPPPQLATLLDGAPSSARRDPATGSADAGEQAGCLVARLRELLHGGQHELTPAQVVSLPPCRACLLLFCQLMRCCTSPACWDSALQLFAFSSRGCGTPVASLQRLTGGSASWRPWLVQEATIRAVAPQLASISAFALAVPRHVRWQGQGVLLLGWHCRAVCLEACACVQGLFSGSRKSTTRAACLASWLIVPLCPAAALQDPFEQQQALPLPSLDSVLSECPGDLEALLGQELGGAAAGGPPHAVGSALRPPRRAGQRAAAALAELDFIDGDELELEQQLLSLASSGTAGPDATQPPQVTRSCLSSAHGWWCKASLPYPLGGFMVHRILAGALRGEPGAAWRRERAAMLGRLAPLARSRRSSGRGRTPASAWTGP